MVAFSTERDYLEVSYSCSKEPGMISHRLGHRWLFALSVAAVAGKRAKEDLFSRDNLVAWCIVPFDAKKRGPEERAEMLARLGFKRFAYDWRAEHIPSFDEEIKALKKHGIQLDAFWFPAQL